MFPGEDIFPGLSLLTIQPCATRDLDQLCCFLAFTIMQSVYFRGNFVQLYYYTLFLVHFILYHPYHCSSPQNCNQTSATVAVRIFCFISREQRGNTLLNAAV